MKLIIRPYAESDFDAVAKVWFDSWESVGIGFPDPSLQAELRERFPKQIADGWSVHVATVGTDIVGFLTLQEDRLQQLFVAPSIQGRGAGKQLLDFVKLQRPKGFWLTTPSKGRAIHFYERERLKRGHTSWLPQFGHAVVRYDWHP